MACLVEQEINNKLGFRAGMDNGVPLIVLAVPSYSRLRGSLDFYAFTIA